MSWSLNFEINREEFHSFRIVPKSLETYDSPAHGIETNASPSSYQRANNTDSEVRTAIKAAANASYDLLNSLGPNWKIAQISMNGHNNTDNKKSLSWGSDFITLNVTIKEY